MSTKSHNYKFWIHSGKIFLMITRSLTIYMHRENEHRYPKLDIERLFIYLFFKNQFWKIIYIKN